MQDVSCPDVFRGRDARTSFERLHGKKPTQEFVPFGEKVLATQISTDPMNRMNPTDQYGVWLGMQNNSAEYFFGDADGVFRIRQIRRLELGRWDKEAINSVIGVQWRMTDGKWTVDGPEARVDPITIPPMPFEEARIWRERVTKQDIDEFGATSGCPGCNAIKDNKRAQAHSDRCRTRIGECLRTAPHGAQRLDRRNEVINEALAEEVRRGEQGKKRSDRATAAVPETESAAPGPRENPIDAAANPKRRLLMKLASLTASGGGQQKDKRSIPVDESRMQVEDTSDTGTGEGTALPAAPSANARRRMVVKSEPVAVTTQEAVDGHCEKSDEDRECRTNRAGQHHGAVNHGSGAQVGKAIELLGRLSLRTKMDGI